MEGTVENAMLQYIIRDHDKVKFEEKKKLFTEAVDFMKNRYGADVLRLEMKDQYYNMKEQVLPVFHVVETAKKAMEDLFIVPKVVPIRGGTDAPGFHTWVCPARIFLPAGIIFTESSNMFLWNRWKKQQKLS